MLKQKNGKWVFVSRKTQRPLAYYRGEGKPSDEWVRKQEQRVQYFKHIGEETVINELFNSPYSVSLLTKTEDEVKYKFETKSKDLYVIVFERLTNFGKPANKWSISFKNKNKNSADDHDTTNTGDEIKVFSSVIDAMKKFVKDYDPQKLSFISTKTNTKGSGGENRSRLYERMLKTLASQNGFKYEVVNTDKTIAFKLTKIKKINEYNENIKTINLNETAYTGNVGFMELVKFHKKASQEQKKMLQSHIQNKKHKEFRDLIKQVTGVELHKTVNEKQEFVSKAGAGEWGRPELTRNYIKGTPGQNVKRFKKYINNI